VRAKADKARRADSIACAERAAAGKRSWGLEDGRVASALEMSEVQERPGGELSLA
jgi:hypothetical protein